MYKLLILITLMLTVNTVSAKNQKFEIVLGNAKISGVMPGGRTIRAPDLAYTKEIDVCNWENLKGKRRGHDSIELLRKVWEFHRFFRAPSGGFVFTISVSNNEKFGRDYKAYFDWLRAERINGIQKINDNGYTDHNYTPPDDFKEFYKDGQKWFTYNSDSNNNKHYRFALNDKLMLRINLNQGDDRKKAVQGEWHPKAEALAKTIIDSLLVSYNNPDDKLCGCVMSKAISE